MSARDLPRSSSAATASRPGPWPAFRVPVGGLTVATVALAVGLALAAASSLANRADLYADVDLRNAFLANDVVVLTFVVPLIMAAAFAARSGTWLGAQTWPGASWLVAYVAFPYVLALPRGAAWLAYLASFVAALYLSVASAAALDPGAAQRRWQGAVPARAIGATTAGFGVLFFVFAWVTLTAGVGDGSVHGPAAAVFAADLLVSPAWILGGIALYRRRPFGFAVAPALLAQLAAAFAALFLVVAIAPLVGDVVASAADVAVLLVMALVATAPLAAFVRAAVRPVQGER